MSLLETAGTRLFVPHRLVSSCVGVLLVLSGNLFEQLVAVTEILLCKRILGYLHPFHWY